MSEPSHWPLPARGARILTPGFMLRELREHPLARGCYPTAIGYYPAAAGHRMTRSRHDDHLLIFCVAGTGQVATDHGEFSLQQQQLLLLPAGNPHRYRADTDQPWSIYWCHFDGNLAVELVQMLDSSMLPVVQTIQRATELRRDFDELLLVRRTGYGVLDYIHAANLLRKIMTAVALEKQHSAQAASRSMDFAEIERYMRANIDRSLRLEDLAALSNLSKFHFSTKYRELTGYSPIKHFVHLKIERACELLDTTDMSVAAVSAAVGYEDPLYFSRLFHKTTGYSPRDYRRNINRTSER